MQYFEISYYRTYHWIDKRYAKSELGCTDALRRSRVKNPINIEEITEKEYTELTARKKASELLRKKNKI